MWNLPTSPWWPSKFCPIFKQKWAALFLNVSTTPRHRMLVLRHTSASWMSYTLMLIQMADVFQRNSSLVELVERNGFDSALSPAPGSGPGAAALITTCTPGHQPPLHFNRNPQICCKWSPLGGIFPFIATVQSAAAHNLLNHPKKCPLQNVNRKWKMNESGWNRLQPTLTHKSDRKAASDCCNTKLALCLCLLHSQTKQQYAYLSVYSSSCVQLVDFLHWHY